jgi:hypothetical protein
VDGVSARQEARRRFVALVDLGLASVNMSLAGRSLFSRISSARIGWQSTRYGGRMVWISATSSALSAVDSLGWPVLTLEIADVG